MKVLCIDGVKTGFKNLEDIPCLPEWEIYEGETYTVFYEMIDESGAPCYFLEEKSLLVPYLKRRFIPLSNIDENEKHNSNNNPCSNNSLATVPDELHENL